ncbi:MAG: protein translocase subunit SecF, partial [Actinobacteria bacterium]|nr:protein translocase subunit SecF [Actinomycetota bacterium]
VTADDVRGTMVDFGFTGAEVQIVGGTELSVRIGTLNELTDTERTKLLDALAEQAGTTPDHINRQDVGPTWGSQISRKAITGLVIFLVAVTAFIAIRFEEWKMALGAQAALAHDLIITAGIYALVGREVTPATVIAILTILGYSLYDTVVIYDKVKENTESVSLLAKDSYSGTVNLSLNQTLMRSVNTSLVVLLPILSLLLFGGETLKDFAFALFIGVTSGAYSSIFVASPILAVLKEREPKYQQIRARATARAASGRQLRSVPADEALAAEGTTGGLQAAAASAATATRSTARTPQKPRPRGKRKPAAKRKRR